MNRLAKFYHNYSLHFSRANYQSPQPGLALRELEKLGVVREGLLPLDKETPILDFGCGWGNVLLGLYEKGYQVLYGIDFNPEMCDIARQYLPKDIPIICSDGREWLQAHPDHLGLIIMNNVIEHIPHDEVVSVLRLMRNSLVPGGMIFISTPNMASLFAGYTRYVDFTHVIGYTEFSLFQVLDLAGFEGHRILPERKSVNLSMWRPWAPWRGLGLLYYFRKALYGALWRIAGSTPRPTCFQSYLDVISYRPMKKGNADV
jgi:2-polyprenyl-3-methyl-5-hydroxy-6-metoxy-1,4-benzoquinol methylase